MIFGVFDMVGSAGEEKDGTGSARAVPGAVIPQRTKRNGRRLLSPAGAMRQKCSRVRTVADSLSHDADWLRHLGARELRTCLPVAACQSRHRFPLLGFCSADRGSSDSRGAASGAAIAPDAGR